MVAVPLICTAPARDAGVTSEARQRRFAFTSRVTSVTGSRWNGLQAARAIVETEIARRRDRVTGIHPPGARMKTPGRFGFGERPRPTPVLTSCKIKDNHYYPPGQWQRSMFPRLRHVLEQSGRQPMGR